MPFFVYGSNAQTGEVARRIYSDAATEAEARAHAEAHGMSVASVIACSPQQRPPDEDVQQARARLAAARARSAPLDVRGAAERAAAISAGAEPRPVGAEVAQLRSESAAFEETLERYTPSTWVSHALIGANVLVFVLMAAFGVGIVNPKVDDLLRWGADFGPQTSHGEWWRLFTSMFVHIGFMHLAFNMLAFAYVGPKVERMLGNAGFLLVYVVAGLGGSVLAIEQNPLQVQAGASGAIFGIYGALFAMLLRRRGSIPEHLAAHMRKSVATFIGYNLIYSLSPGISMAAHLGGLVTGFVCGFAIVQPPGGEDAIAGRPLRNAMVVGLGVVVIGVGIAAVHARYPGLSRVNEVIERFAVVEKQSRETFAAAKQRADEAKLSQSDFADLIESRLLPDWRSTREEIGQLAQLPSPKLGKLGVYMQMRQQQLESLAGALRREDEEAVTSALEDGKYGSDRLSNWSAAK